MYTEMEWWTRIRLDMLRGEVSKREILRREGIHWETLKKIEEYCEPPGYRIGELINALAAQQKFALQACYCVLGARKGKTSTGQAYQIYEKICERQGSRALTQRRFCDVISFLDLYGLISARVVSMGRFGKTREIQSSLPDDVALRLRQTEFAID